MKTIAFSLLITASLLAADQRPKPTGAELMPRVFIDGTGAKVFHSPTCKLVKPDMIKVSRTAAKMQGIQPAPECAQTDEQARAEWKKLVAKDPSIASAGRTSQVTASLHPIPKGTTSSGSSARITATQSTAKAEPSWNEYMKATDYQNAEGRAREKCRGEWAGDPRMQQYCFERQLNAVNTLRRSTVTADRAKRIKCASEWPDDFRMRVYCEGK